MIDRVSPGERFSAGRFALEAAEVITDIRARGHLPLVVGGTGLYVKALVEGLFHEPPLDRPRRERLALFTATLDHPTLVRWASRLDRAYALAGGRQRATRAIEIALLTGRSLSWWQRSAEAQGVVRPWTVRLTVPRPVLHQRIRVRAEEMVRRGLLQEVAAVLADGAPPEGPGMDGIGVREAVAVLLGTLPRDQLVEAIVIATRQYAKRQETWFRHQVRGDVLTLDATRPPDDLAAAIIAAWEQTSG
jgi:tRNA dimethylallyltransferase